MENVKDILDKLIDGLYVDVVDGLLKDYVVKEYPNKGPLVVHALLNNDAYSKDSPNGHGGWFNLAEMKKRMGNLMRYVNLEVVDVDVVPYFDNSPEDMLEWEKLISGIEN